MALLVMAVAVGVEVLCSSCAPPSNPKWGRQKVASGDFKLQAINGAEYDAGNVERGAVIKHSFQVINTTERLVRIGAISKTCGCTETSVSDKVLKSGGVSSVSVSIDTSGKSGIFQGVIIPREEGGDGLPLCVLRIRALVGREFSVYGSPSTVDLGCVGSLDLATGVVLFISTSRSDATPLSPGVRVVKGEHFLLSDLREAPTAGEVSRGRREFVGSIATNGTRAVGRVSDILEVPFRSDENTEIAKIQIVAQYSAPEIHVPGKIVLARTGDLHTGRGRLRLSNPTDSSRLRCRTSVEWLDATVEKGAAEAEFTLVVTGALPADVADGAIAESVYLWLDGGLGELETPVYCDAGAF